MVFNNIDSVSKYRGISNDDILASRFFDTTHLYTFVLREDTVRPASDVCGTVEHGASRGVRITENQSAISPQFYQKIRVRDVRCRKIWCQLINDPQPTT